MTGRGSNARWWRNRKNGLVIQDEVSSEPMTSDNAQGARAPRRLLASSSLGWADGEEGGRDRNRGGRVAPWPRDRKHGASSGGD